jgi:hypothetical protein
VTIEASRAPRTSSIPTLNSPLYRRRSSSECVSGWTPCSPDRLLWSSHLRHCAPPRTSVGNTELVHEAVRFGPNELFAVVTTGPPSQGAGGDLPQQRGISSRWSGQRLARLEPPKWRSRARCRAARPQRLG